MSLQISVSPSGSEWVLETDHPPQTLAFPTGGRAETAARALARLKAEEGVDAEVRIYVRGGALAGVLSFPARFASGAGA